ncbi:mannonate dehydratase [Conexibacter woesei]|uniref:mannonate dehydratase n=1 Tax=Conexibacter woesei (strain DSM 14684 / CCUG 47730 / CIP 108061 / JCM 11494 / NBRC 100937 / ID131577) TaxID=469383 RepID=D3F8G4_CONWI|nr:mannonate dehydratase [Conexibacter woesei]ADB50928.1 Mannonate dehydratase [Conexibacter woesei DSM 14684]
MTEPALAEILLEKPPHPFWTVLRQLGIEQAVGVLPRYHADWRESAGEQPWDLMPLTLYRDQVAEAGLRLAAIEDNPPMDKLRLGLPGREEELEAVLRLIRSMGTLGIPVWCYNWMPVLGWMRTRMAAPTRGGALVSSWDAALLADAPLTYAGFVPDEQLWEALAWFLERVCPVAEEAGVTLALHPDDPPLSPIRGIARIMSRVESFERLVDLNDSPANRITLCQGNFALMTDDLPATIRRLGERIAFAHFRDVRGTPERFEETFHDDGPTDMLACMRAYREIGFRGVLRSDHVPTIAGDSAAVAGYSHQARLHAIGYMAGLREAVARA